MNILKIDKLDFAELNASAKLQNSFILDSIDYAAGGNLITLSPGQNGKGLYMEGKVRPGLKGNSRSNAASLERPGNNDSMTMLGNPNASILLGGAGGRIEGSVEKILNAKS